MNAISKIQIPDLPNIKIDFDVAGTVGQFDEHCKIRKAISVLQNDHDWNNKVDVLLCNGAIRDIARAGESALVADIVKKSSNNQIVSMFRADDAVLSLVDAGHGMCVLNAIAGLRPEYQFEILMQHDVLKSFDNFNHRFFAKNIMKKWDETLRISASNKNATACWMLNVWGDRSKWNHMLPKPKAQP